MNFFKTKTRAPTDVVRSLRDAVPRLESSVPGSDTRRKATEDISRHLQYIKGILFGENDSTPELIAQVAQELYNADLLPGLLASIHRFERPAQKCVEHIFLTLLRRQIGTRFPTVEHLATNNTAVFQALAGYEHEEAVTHTGPILKEMLKHEQLAKLLLYSEQFYRFPHYIEANNFQASSDAYANFRELLTKHKPMVAGFLEQNYDRFFASYNTLILSDNYVIKRQSLKLLGEILLDRSNFNTMSRYIGNEANLKMVMNRLRDHSKNVQFESFHVFKVFVANPNKPPQIEAILRRNKEKIITFLGDFHNDKDDEQFRDEKQFLVAQMRRL